MAYIEKYTTQKGTLWRFQISYTDPATGKRLKKSKSGFRLQKEARVAAEELESQLLNGFTDSRMTFNQVYRQWFDNYKLTVKESTWTTTKRNFENHILPAFGNEIIGKITPAKCQLIVNEWFKKPLKNYKRFANNISGVFKYAVRLKIVKSNPIDAIIIPSNRRQMIKKSKKSMYYSRNELQKFLECLQESGTQQAYTFFRLLAFTGMRKGEVLALQWRDINFFKHKISINKTQSNGDGKLIIQSTKTAASEREIFIDNKTLGILKDWKKKQKVQLFQLGFNSSSKDQLVFSSTLNKMHNPNKPRVWMSRITEEYDLKHIPVHGFRHTYATLAIQGGMPRKSYKNN
ncbi:tyrosine-type recombinase/integrase [Liquorilactobacillus hordei]|uniref:tyrosine-type recombinase/integrase n=1 Tax=Liquorilactobacillus hordei TaxID=468911 RepID=UPI001EFE03F3|nr:site-specific integrase [Liquorilactobacillus hordei]